VILGASRQFAPLRFKGEVSFQVATYCVVVAGVPPAKTISAADTAASTDLFAVGMRKLLKPRIAAQRVEIWIEMQQRWSNGIALLGHQQTFQSRDRNIVHAKLRGNTRTGFLAILLLPIRHLR
jgi:hypothetical protein